MRPPRIPPPSQLRKRFDLRPRRGIGQHFLTDGSILNRIAERVRILISSTVVYEVGTGPGYLTAYLLAKEPLHLVGLEMDDRFAELHKEIFEPFLNVTIHYGDVLDQDFESLQPPDTDLNDLVIAGNIPYQITSPLLFKIWEGPLRFRKSVFTVQKEVAERLVAQPGSKAFGLLTLKAQYFCKPVIEFEIPSSKFRPPPKVKSAVISFTPHDQLAYAPRQQKRFFSLLDGAFSQRRKKILNSISGSPPFPIGKDKLLHALQRCVIDPDTRAENLSLEQFHRLFQSIEEN